MNRFFCSDLWSHIRELVLYCCIGCTGAAIDFALYSVITGYGHIHYQIANYIGVSVGIVNNFILNYYLNFRVRGGLARRLVCFYCVGMIGCLISAGCLWLFVEKFMFNVILAKLITIILVTITQFCLNKFITFRKKGA